MQHCITYEVHEVKVGFGELLVTLRPSGHETESQSIRGHTKCQMIRAKLDFMSNLGNLLEEVEPFVVMDSSIAMVS